MGLPIQEARTVVILTRIFFLVFTVGVMVDVVVVVDVSPVTVIVPVVQGCVLVICAIVVVEVTVAVVVVAAAMALAKKAYANQNLEEVVYLLVTELVVVGTVAVVSV